MLSPPPASGRGTRLALVLLALFALLVLVAFASRTGFGGHASHARPSDTYVSYAFTALLILFAASIPLAAYLWVAQVREGLLPQKGFVSRVARNILIIILVVAFIGTATTLRHRLATFFGHDQGGAAGAPGKAGPALHGSHRQFAPRFEWPVVWVTIALVVAIAAYVVKQRRLNAEAPAGELEPDVADDLAATIGDAIDDLRAEPDARRAVIAAYARMEGVLGRSGHRRRSSETPTEYLQRILLGVTSRRSDVATLTRLFERAKFSQHEIDEGMKLKAIDALTAIRDDLIPEPVPA